MAIEATYALNSFLKPLVAAVDGSVVFYPGKSAPENQGKVLVLYNVNQNNPFELFMINSDVVTYRVIHTDYELMQKMSGAISGAVNIWSVAGLFTGTTDSGKAVTPLHLWCMSSPPGEDFFPDGVKYYYQVSNLQYTYKLV